MFEWAVVIKAIMNYELRGCVKSDSPSSESPVERGTTIKKGLSRWGTADWVNKVGQGGLIFPVKASAGASLLLACLAAVGAALRFVLQTFFLIKSLFAFSKDEFLAAVFAN